MNISEKKVVPYRIKQARISRGLSMLELAELVEVSKQAISQYELGRNEPKDAILYQLSNILKYPIDFFYKPMPINNASNSPVFFRAGKTSRVRDKNAAREKIDIFREITDFLSEYVDFPRVQLPKVSYHDDGTEPLDNDTIEQYAMELRSFWNLGEGPIDNLMTIIQKNGIMVSKMNLRLGKLDAFSVWYSGRPFIFLSSDKDTNVRIRFDIAHELGHMVMHADYYNDDDIKKSAISEKIEDEANRFAAAFMLPKESFSKDVFSSSIDHFVNLKSKWKMSIGSMIYRCDSLGILSPNQIKYLKDQMTAKLYWKKEPLDSSMAVEKPFVHKQAIMLLLDNNILTPREIVEKIGCQDKEIEQYCFLDEGTLQVKEPDNVIRLNRRFI